LTALAYAAVACTLIATIGYLTPRLLTLRINLQQMRRIEEIQLAEPEMTEMTPKDWVPDGHYV